jgi:SAM-dependent methyltransferase
MNALEVTPGYPLGTHREELERLQLQHRLWCDAAHALWRRAGIAPGSRVLDVGAGPGAASLDLAELVGASGTVLAVDESEAFVERIGDEAARRGLPQIIAARGDVQALGRLADPNANTNPVATATARAASFDLAYARWILCFTPKPEDVVRGVAALLRPGGMLCVHDYDNYETMSPAPRRESYTRIVRAAAASWRDRGGDPDVVARLPRILHDAGFELVHLDVHQRLARAGDTMWHWAASWWRSYGPKLVTLGYLSEGELREFESDFEAMARETDFLVLPPVYELMARLR